MKRLILLFALIFLVATAGFDGDEKAGYIKYSEYNLDAAVLPTCSNI